MLAVDREADSEQAEVFHRLLIDKRAALCDQLDEHASKMADYERAVDSVHARRKWRRFKQIGAEIRDIDRMLGALHRQLLREQCSRPSA